ncbi:MAG: ABC transporter substrate-binding protein [Clostridiales Family XIII bacterium]|jgi:polar amino acid transport system substrate-binding protein|nr:ABC transporter substrate-binding protein [Clostridiales Family XIII bacterium]
MKRLKTGFSVFFVIALVFGLAACSGGGASSDSGAGSSASIDYGASYLEGIKEKGTLVVGCDPTIQNIAYMDDAGNVTGFIPDLVGGYAEQLGVEVKWEVLEWSAMITALNSGKVDMVAANMNMTLERESQILLSDCWLLDHAMACVLKDSSFQTFEDLQAAGVKFGVTQGSAYEDIIRDTFPNAEIVTLSAGTWQDSLISGIIDAAYDDGVVFAGPVTSNDQLRILEETGDAYMDGFAFAAGNYVPRDTFNLYLTKLKVTGVYADIYSEWMGFDWKPESQGASF